MKPFFLVILFIACSCAATAQEHELQLIKASQGGGFPLFFKIGKGEAGIPLSGFNHQQECLVRNGLAGFYAKVQQKQPVTIAFIGGSITQSKYGYRMQAAKSIQALYPLVDFKWINAGIAGTGTDLGACRLYDQVLQFNPDLIFIEFAVNGAFAGGMEGIIRQIIRHNPRTGICLLYTITASQVPNYENGQTPPNIQLLENIADHYRIPSVHLALEAVSMKKEGRLAWTASFPENGNIQFSTDGVHPTIEGGNIYAGALVRGLLKLMGHPVSAGYEMPSPLFSGRWASAGMYDPAKMATFDGQWESIKTSNNQNLNQFSHWFPRIMYSGKPGSSFSFKFKGTMFGLFDIGGPEVGQLEVKLDGKRVNLLAFSQGGYYYFAVSNGEQGGGLVDRFNKHCNNRYRGQAFFVEVPDGVHTVQFIIAAEKTDKKSVLGKVQLEDITKNPEKYNRTDLYLGKILLRGAVVAY